MGNEIAIEDVQKYSVDEARCIYCAACSSLAPSFIKMKERAAFIFRQPHTKDEISEVMAASFNCPASAIRNSKKIIL